MNSLDVEWAIGDLRDLESVSSALIGYLGIMDKKHGIV
jgi:hypothetical protein